MAHHLLHHGVQCHCGEVELSKHHTKDLAGPGEKRIGVSAQPTETSSERTPGRGVVGMLDLLPVSLSKPEPTSSSPDHGS